MSSTLQNKQAHLITNGTPIDPTKINNENVHQDSLSHKPRKNIIIKSHSLDDSTEDKSKKLAVEQGDLNKVKKLEKPPEILQANPEFDEKATLKKLFPFEINEIIVEIAQADLQYESDNLSEQQQEIKRLKQHNCLYIIVILCSLITATQNLYIFLGTLPYRDLVVTFPTVILRIIFLPIATYRLCNNWRVLLRLTFMVDKVMLAGVLQYIGVMGFILIFIPYTPSAWFYHSLMGLYPLYWLIYIGNFRVSMVYCDWSKTQTVIYKITLLIGSTSYFILGVYYLVDNLKFTRGLSPKLDESIENLLLIYINAGFQVYLEMIARMDTVDGSVRFKMDYKLHCDPEDMQLLLKGRKQNIESDQSSSDSDLSDQSDSIKIQDLEISEVISEYERKSGSKSRERKTKRFRRKIILGEDQDPDSNSRQNINVQSILDIEDLYSAHPSSINKKQFREIDNLSFEAEITKRGII